VQGKSCGLLLFDKRLSGILHEPKRLTKGFVPFDSNVIHIVLLSMAWWWWNRQSRKLARASAPMRRKRVNSFKQSQFASPIALKGIFLTLARFVVGGALLISC
jgi:hypothetical protein